MPFDVQISLQKLLTGLIIVIVPLSILGLYLCSNADRDLERTIGIQFRALALTDAATTAQFIGDRITDVRSIASDPAIVDAVRASNRQYLGVGEETIGSRIQKIEAQWDSPNADLRLKDMLSSRASRWLQQECSFNRRLLKIIISDENGAAVAATGKPIHYVEADQQLWQAAYAGGKGAVNVTEVSYDASTQSDYVDIAVPVLEEDSGRFMGVVRALVDVSGLFSTFNQQRLGRSGRVMLVTSKGVIVSAPNVTPDLRLLSDEFTAVRDALGTTEGRQTGYVKAATTNGECIVGFADTELKRSQPKLDWVILVSQREREALAPLRILEQFAVVMVVLGVLMLTGLLAYFWTQRQQQLADLVVMEPNKESQGTQASA